MSVPRPVERAYFLWPTWVALAAALVVVAGGQASGTIGWTLLLAGTLVIGMPHGAVDHLVPRLIAGSTRQPSMAEVVGIYSAVTIAGVGLWFLSPLAALALFLGVAIVHWGHGELWFLQHAWPASAPRSRRELLLAAAARGLLPVAAPLLLHPAASERAVNALLDPFGASLPELDAGIGTAARVLVGAIVILAILDAARRRSWPEVAELAALSAFVAVTPPVFAVAVYFAAWHSLRHVARLRALLPDARPQLAIRRLAAMAAPTTLAAFAGCAALAGLVVTGPGTATSIAAPTLAVIAALTVPHAMVVGWMEQRGA